MSPSGEEGTSVPTPICTTESAQRLRGETVGFSDPAFDFVRSLRVFHVRAFQQRGHGGTDDLCQEWDRTEVGTYDADGGFAWRDGSLGALPPAFVRPAAGGGDGCPAYWIRAVFIEWRAQTGTPGHERIDY